MNVSCAKRNETTREQQILTPNKFGRLKATGSNYNSPNNAYFMNAKKVMSHFIMIIVLLKKTGSYDF